MPFIAQAQQCIAINAQWHSGIVKNVRHDLFHSEIAGNGEGREHYVMAIIEASDFLTITNNSYNQPF